MRSCMHVTFWPADRKHRWHMQTWQTEEHANSITNLKLYTPATSKECNWNWGRLQKFTSCAQIQTLEGFTCIALSQSCIDSDITVTSVLSEDGCSSLCEGHEIWKGTAAAHGQRWWCNRRRRDDCFFRHNGESWTSGKGQRLLKKRRCLRAICRPKPQTSFVLKLSSSCWSKYCFPVKLLF